MTCPGVGVEPQADVAGRLLTGDSRLRSNTGLTPSTLIDPATGQIDMTKRGLGPGELPLGGRLCSPASWSPSASWRCAICATTEGAAGRPERELAGELARLVASLLAHLLHEVEAAHTMARK